MRSGYACLLALVVALLGQTAKADPHPDGRTLAAPPSIILILSDDEDVPSHNKVMTKTQELIERQGVVFKNFFVTQAFCCPSRATLQRGQYPHNTGIEDITLPLGGYLKWKREGLGLHTVATWLHKRGYRTVYAGKYLNNYYPDRDGVPHGWDEWYVGGDAPYFGFDYDLNENGKIVHYGNAPEDYATDVLARKAADAMQRAARNGVPLFMIVAPFTPHPPAIPAPRHLGRFAHEPLPPTWSSTSPR
jgi:N-acetylglucosamine-6-sulfatase